MSGEAQIVEISKNEIHLIQPLWNALNQHHWEQSAHFKSHFCSFSFSDRCRKLLAAEALHILAAQENNQLVGYCIASTHQDVGEIDSLYVLPEYRSQQLGEILTTKAMEWLTQQSCSELNVYVAEGNEQASSFYERFGFRHRFNVLQIKNPK